jgi:beta-galactosidase GanA
VTDLEYTEVLELRGASVIASFEDGSPAVMAAPCGKGQAYYLAVEPNHTFIEHLLRKLTGAAPLPGDVHAREIAPGVRFYVNTGNKRVDIPLEAPGSGLLAGRDYTDVLTLPPYGAELVRFS